MLSIYRQLFFILDARERRRFLLLLGMVVVMGLFEVVGVASILPFLAVLAEPEAARSNPYLARIYETLRFDDTQSFLIFLGVASFLMLLLSVLVRVGTLYAIVRFSNLRNYSISTRLLGTYLRQPYVWFLHRHSANLGKSVLSEVDKVVGGALIPTLRVTAYTISTVFIVGFLVAIQPVVAITAALVLGGAYGLIYLATRRYLTHLGRIRLQANSERFKIAQEAMGGIKEVKLLGLEETYLARFSMPARRMAETASAGQIIGELPRYLLELMAFGGMLLLILVMLFAGTGTLAEILPILGLFAFAGLRMLPAVQQIYHSMAQIRLAKPTLDALHRDISEASASAGQRNGAHPPLPLRRSLDLVDVHYAYPQAGRMALNGLSLSVAARTTVGIVGGTGAGKTTAVDLILGLLWPDRGELRIDGAPLSPDKLRSWQNNVGYVPQSIFLTDDTVSANIALGIPEDRRDQAAVERAAHLAELHDFVVGNLPQKYQTLVGERGVRLSGGQRQRIGIARALYRDPEVLILDEATSALDNLTERAVMDAVRNIGHSKTIIMIAHRLTTVRDCDVIFFLENGVVAAVGSYDDLIENCENFRLMAAQ